MTVAGGLGPLPTEAKLLHEFIPAEDVVKHVEAVIRIFNRHGNRNNKNKARLKFVMRERGFDWLRDAIAEEFRDIERNGGIAIPAEVPDGFGGFQAHPAPRGTGDLLPVYIADPDYQAWRETNVRKQKQAGYAIVTVKTPQGNLTGEQMRKLADLADQAGDGMALLVLGHIDTDHGFLVVE